MTDRTALLLLIRKRDVPQVHVFENAATWLTGCAPYWVVLVVCKLLGDWGPTINTSGGREWRVGGKLHRIHGPAVIGASGTLAWWRNGKLHRDEDAPALIYPQGTQEWWRDGELHRDGDAPAIIHRSGTREWWRHGERYRWEEASVIHP